MIHDHNNCFYTLQARKALHALKGLVKIQAIVRGHLVRKQTTDIIRGMQALMSIQFRARFQRIQMAEESKLLVKSQSSRHRYFPKENGFDGASRVIHQSPNFHLCSVNTFHLISSHSVIKHSMTSNVSEFMHLNPDKT